MSTTAEDLKRRISGRGTSADALRTRISEAPSANFVAREFAARGVADAALATPSASGGLIADALKAGEAGVKTAAGYGLDNVRRVLGMDQVKRPSFGERYATESNAFDSALRSIPRPTTRKIDAAVASVPSLMPGGESPGEAYERNLFDGGEEEAALRAAHPTAAMVGEIGGDVGSIALARRGSGAGGLVRRVENRLTGRAAVEAAESLSGDVLKILKGPTMQQLARGAGRSLEAGVEAAALDILKDPDADPVETAALTAGGHMVGSGFLGATSSLFSGGLTQAGLKMSVLAASSFGLVQVLKSATPGGEDRILESIETGYDKVAFGMAMGVASAAIGATRYGRGNTNLSDQTRTFLDGLSTVHRGTTLSLLTDWTEGDAQDRAAIERVLTAISKDPHYQGETEAERSIVRQIRRGSGLERRSTGGEF